MDSMKITTIPEALEAQRLADRLWVVESIIENGKCPAPEGACAAAAEFLEAFSAHIAAPVAVVKPLEWTNGGEIDGVPEAWSGGYAVEHTNFGYFVIKDGVVISKNLRDFEAAKAAAQADYEARILSALTIQPAAQAQAEAVAKAIRDAEIRGQAKAGAIFATSGAEQAYIDAGNVACPACGGSGHQDDATAALSRRDAETRKAALREALELADASGFVSNLDLQALIDKEPK